MAPWRIIENLAEIESKNHSMWGTTGNCIGNGGHYSAFTQKKALYFAVMKKRTVVANMEITKGGDGKHRIGELRGYDNAAVSADLREAANRWLVAKDSFSGIEKYIIAGGDVGQQNLMRALNSAMGPDYAAYLGGGKIFSLSCY